MPLLIAPHVVPPSVVVESVWQSLGVTWTGPDGTVFDFTDIDGGVILQQNGVVGMTMPPFVRYTSTAPGIAGSRNRGYRTLERPVFWPMLILADSSAEFFERWAAFNATLAPGVVGVWAVTNPITSETRRLTCRYSDESTPGNDFDPFQVGWISMGFDLVAEQPYWLGDPVVRAFAAPDDIQFFVNDSGASGDVFEIAPGGTTDSAFIPNPGDEDAWPTYVVTDVAGATLGAGGGSVVVGAVASGVRLTIITDPDTQTAIDSDGVDRTADVTWNALPVPKGSEVQLALTLDTPGATASVVASVQPVHYRAFG